MILEYLFFNWLKRFIGYKTTRYRIVKVEYADNSVRYMLERKHHRLQFWQRKDKEGWTHLSALKEYIEEHIKEEKEDYEKHEKYRKSWKVKKESIVTVYQNE